MSRFFRRVDMGNDDRLGSAIKAAGDPIRGICGDPNDRRDTILSEIVFTTHPEASAAQLN